MRQVSNAGMASVATLSGLRSLDVGGCPMVSEPGVAMVASALIDLRELRYAMQKQKQTWQHQYHLTPQL